MEIETDSLDQLSMDQLRDLYDELTLRVQSIDLQMGTRKPVGKVGQAEWREYLKWKASAGAAKVHLSRRKAECKSEIRRRNDCVESDDVEDMAQAVIVALGIEGDGDKCAAVLGAVRRVLVRWEQEDPT